MKVGYKVVELYCEVTIRFRIRLCAHRVDEEAVVAVAAVVLEADGRAAAGWGHEDLGLYPIVTSQYSSPTLYQGFHHIQ